MTSDPKYNVKEMLEHIIVGNFLFSIALYVNNISMPFGYGLQFSLRLTLALGIVTYAKYLSHIWHVRLLEKQWSQNSMNSIMQ